MPPPIRQDVISGRERDLAQQKRPSAAKETYNSNREAVLPPPIRQDVLGGINIAQVRIERASTAKET